MSMELNNKIKLSTAITSTNLVSEFDEDDLATIADEVVDGYEVDKESRQGWEDQLDEWMEMALQVAKDKTYPWPNASNVKYPLLTTAAIQFSSRAYPALIPGTNIVKGRPIGEDLDGSKLEKSRLIGKHMSYQILEQMPSWEEEMDRLCVSLPILGTMFKKTYYDPTTNRNVSELVYPKDLYVNYWAKSLEDAPRVTHKIELQENDIYERVAAGIYADYGDALEVSISDLQEKTDIDGNQAPAVDDETTPYSVIEQHLYLDLDGDGYKEPYIVTVHTRSKKVLRIVARFSEEGINETDAGEIVKIVPDNYFTKFSFVPNPDGGFYDVGFGLLLGPINETVNTIINQLVDSGSLNNLQAGFIAKGLRIKGGNFGFKPGEWKSVNSVGDDLRKGIVPLPTKEPSNVLFTLLGMMIESGQKLASVTDMLLGENPGQNQPATTTMAVLEQGLKVFTSIYKRLHRSLRKEYQKIFVLNSKYLSDSEWFTILDTGDEQGAEIRRYYYDLSGADVVPASDPNVASESMKLLKASSLLELVGLGTVNPQEVTRRVLEAQEQPAIEALMTMPEQGPSPEQIKIEADIRLRQDELALKREEMKAKTELEWAKYLLEAKKVGIDDLKQQVDGFVKIGKLETDRELAEQKQRDASKESKSVKKSTP